MQEAQFRGLALMIGAMYGLDLFSAFMSSPWSTEAFSEGTATKAASARRLVLIAMVTAVAVGGTASYLTDSWWPLIGSGGAAAVMWLLYEDALRRGAAAAATSGAS